MSLRYSLQNVIYKIQKEEIVRFDNIKKETDKLFQFLCTPYEKKLLTLMN